MSLYKVKPNYQRLYESLLNNYGYSVDVDPHTMDFILEIKDEKQASAFTEEDWANKTTEATENSNIAMIMALINSPYLPEMYQWQLFDEIEEPSILLTSEHLKNDLIYEIYLNYNKDFKNIVSEQGCNFSNKVLDFLCFDLRRDDLENVLEFTPFMFIKNDSDTLNKINKILDNGDVPEKLTVAIAENVNLPERVRNQAFDIGYNPSRLSATTERMLTELYKTHADTVFDINPETDEEKSIIQNARKRLLYYSKYNHLPESCQIDLMERCVKDKSNGDIALNLIKHTDYPSVIATAQKSSILSGILSKLPEIILENPTSINDKVMKELIKDVHPVNAREAFIKAAYKHPFSEEMIQHFIKDEDINTRRVIVCSYESSINQVNDALHESWEKRYYRELLYLKDIRNVCVNFVNKNNIQKIINTALYECIEKSIKDKKIPATSTTNILKKELENQGCINWAKIYNNDKEALDNVLHMLHKNFPDLQDITDKLLNKINKTHINTKLALKYKDIFKGDGGKSLDIPFDSFNVEEFIKLDDEKKKEFINDIKENGDKDMCKKIQEDILYACDDCDCYYDIVAMNVYKCGELFEAVDDIVHPQTKEEKEVPSTDDYYTFR